MLRKRRVDWFGRERQRHRGLSARSASLAATCASLSSSSPGRASRRSASTVGANRRGAGKSVHDEPRTSRSTHSANLQNSPLPPLLLPPNHRRRRRPYELPPLALSPEQAQRFERKRHKNSTKNCTKKNCTKNYTKKKDSTAFLFLCYGSRSLRFLLLHDARSPPSLPAPVPRVPLSLVVVGNITAVHASVAYPPRPATASSTVSVALRAGLFTQDEFLFATGVWGPGGRGWWRRRPAGGVRDCMGHTREPFQVCLRVNLHM